MVLPVPVLPTRRLWKCFEFNDFKMNMFPVSGPLQVPNCMKNYERTLIFVAQGSGRIGGRHHDLVEGRSFLS